MLKISLAEKCQTSMALKQDNLEKLTAIPKPLPFNEGSLRKCGLLVNVKRISKLQEPAMRFRLND